MTEDQNDPVETETTQKQKNKGGRPRVAHPAQLVGVRLPPWIIEKLKERNHSIAKTIQYALCKTYEWKKPADADKLADKP